MKYSCICHSYKVSMCNSNHCTCRPLWRESRGWSSTQSGRGAQSSTHPTHYTPLTKSCKSTIYTWRNSRYIMVVSAKWCRLSLKHARGKCGAGGSPHPATFNLTSQPRWPSLTLHAHTLNMSRSRTLLIANRHTWHLDMCGHCYLFALGHSCTTTSP